MRARSLLIAVMGLVLVVAPARASHADWHVGLDEDSVEAGVGVGAGGSGSTAGGASGYTYVWTLDRCTPGGSAHEGPGYWVLVFGPAGLVVGEYCGIPGVAPVPPAPPTAEEVFQQAPLPKCAINVDPDQKGLTGLEAWLWCEQLREVTVTATIRGYVVQASASPKEIRWLMGDGRTHVSPKAGSKENPSAEHVYETKGDYTIVADVLWSGTYSFVGNGISDSGSLGSVTVDSDRGYHVTEARAVLQG